MARLSWPDKSVRIIRARACIRAHTSRDINGQTQKGRKSERLMRCYRIEHAMMLRVRSHAQIHCYWLPAACSSRGPASDSLRYVWFRVQSNPCFCPDHFQFLCLSPCVSLFAILCLFFCISYSYPVFINVNCGKRPRTVWRRLVTKPFPNLRIPNVLYPLTEVWS